jgi:23S rRNA (cytidine2498-2'-O)-methyltransferase
MTPTLILTADADFAELAWRELHGVCPDARQTAVCAPGVWVVATAVPFFTLAEQWRRQPPVFVRHICPVHQIVAPQPLPQLAAAIGQEMAGYLEPELPFSVQTRLFGTLPFKPYDLNTAVAQQVAQQTDAAVDVRHPVQILSVVCTEQAVYVGLSLAVHNVSAWAGGVRRFAREPEQISRAEFKLLEALEFFRIELPPRGIALDLGAAPGGRTRVLRQREQLVTAVDPGQLHPTLQQDKNVRHLPMTAEMYLTQYPDKYDFMVNDMRLDARDSARLMAAYAPYLYAHGSAVMTFKLPEDGRDKVLEQAFHLLRAAYVVAGAHHFFHNRSEITVWLRPLGK